MLSLFSSFDAGLFSFSMISLVLFPFLLCFSFWKLSYTRLFRQSAFFGMSLFFRSLSRFKFKSSDNLIFSLMSCILMFNLFSIFPYFFSFTSQVSFNLYWGLGSWFSFFLFSLFYNFKRVLSHFIPEGTPLLLIWFLFFVELVRNIIRPLTLVVRLLANILAGHLLLILLSKLVFLFSPFFLLYLGLNLVELFVSLIQSYIFVTILSLYLSEIN